MFMAYIIMANRKMIFKCILCIWILTVTKSKGSTINLAALKPVSTLENITCGTKGPETVQSYNGTKKCQIECHGRTIPLSPVIQPLQNCSPENATSSEHPFSSGYPGGDSSSPSVSISRSVDVCDTQTMIPFGDTYSASWWIFFNYTANFSHSIDVFQLINSNASIVSIQASLLHDFDISYHLLMTIRNTTNHELSWVHSARIAQNNWTHIAIQTYLGKGTVSVNGVVSHPFDQDVPSISRVDRLIVGGTRSSPSITEELLGFVSLDDFKWYPNGLLTNREIAILAGKPIDDSTGTFNECRCPPSNPKRASNDADTCVTQNGKNPKPRISQSYGLANINDGDMNTAWISTSAKEVTIDINLEQKFLVDRYELHFGSFPWTRVTFNRENEGAWYNSTRESYGIFNPACMQLRKKRQVACNLPSSYVSIDVPERFRYEEPATKVRFTVGHSSPVNFIIHEITIFGRCHCNGHGPNCTLTQLPVHYYCACTGNTTGVNCELCIYNHERINHFGNGTLMDDCKACECNKAGTKISRNGFCSSDFKAEQGESQCMCKKFVEGSLCDQCKPGFFNLSTANSDGCDPCSCHPAGSVSGLCSSSDGQCDCKETANPELAGKRCVPYITKLNPDFGPQAGGTVVTVYGAFLNNTSIYIGGNLCRSTSYRNNDSFHICTTSNYAIPKSLNIQLKYMDGLMEDTLNQFSYKPNPIITNVEPRRATITGGILITIQGQNLDSTKLPEFRVTMVYKEIRNISIGVCHDVGNPRTMFCRTPTLTYILPDGYSEISNDKSLNDGNLQFYLGFIFDGYEVYRNVSDVLPTRGSLRVYQDPEIHNFEEKDRVKSFDIDERNQVDIQGEYMDLGCTVNDYEVFVGKTKCKIVSLKSNLLVFEPPTTPHHEVVVGPDGSYPVNVHVGYLRVQPGYIKYVDDQWIVTVAVVVTVVVVLVIVIPLGVLLWIRKRKKPLKSPPTLDELDLEPMPTEVPPSNNQNQVHKENARDYTCETDYLAPDVTSRPSIVDSLPYEIKLQIQDCIIKAENVEVLHEIGKGQYGRVYFGHLKDEKTGKIFEVAIKTIKDSDVRQDEMASFLEEAMIMKDFHHHNVLSLHGVAFMSDERPYVLLPFMEKGDLKHYIADENNIFNVAELLNFGLQVCRGMEYLANERFVHRDLAARNCMINKDGVVKIADFGLSRDIYMTDYYRMENQGRQALPVKWMAIESLLHGTYSEKSDVWSFGILLWELLTRGGSPYPDVSNFDMKEYIQKGRRISCPPHCPPQLYTFMASCWRENPRNRPTFTQLRKWMENLLHGVQDESNADYGYLEFKPGT